MLVLLKATGVVSWKFVLAAMQTARGPLGKAFAFLGYISYGLYLVNWFVFTKCDSFLERTAFQLHLHDPAWLVATFIAYSAISVAIAFVSRRYMEERFLRLKAHT